MRLGTPPVVKVLPATLNRSQASAFLLEVEPVLKAERAQIVFDFSQVRQMDGAGVEMLLHCMEEVMKRNGDLKLAAVAAGPRAVLEFTGIDGLFEIYEDAAQAVQSFNQLPAEAFEQLPPVWYRRIAQESELP